MCEKQALGCNNVKVYLYQALVDKDIYQPDATSNRHQSWLTMIVASGAMIMMKQVDKTTAAEEGVFQLRASVTASLDPAYSAAFYL